MTIMGNWRNEEVRRIVGMKQKMCDRANQPSNPIDMEKKPKWHTNKLA